MDLFSPPCHNDRMSRFLDALHSGRVLLMDGAMGTELQRAGIGEGECYEAWNLTHPDKVLAIHKAYVDAGADVLLTNTFQAMPSVLSQHNLDGPPDEVVILGLELAQNVAGAEGHVLLDFAPWPVPDDFYLLRNAVQHADALLLETANDVGGWRQITAVCEHKPLLWSFTFRRDSSGNLTTATGWTPQQCAGWATVLRLAALGGNCGKDVSAKDMVEILQGYRSATDLPLFARPNAGTPTKVDGRWVYPVTPKQMADAVPAMIEAGATMIGGCCGTTPAHIAAMRRAIDDWNARHGK